MNENLKCIVLNANINIANTLHPISMVSKTYVSDISNF